MARTTRGGDFRSGRAGLTLATREDPPACLHCPLAVHVARCHPPTHTPQSHRVHGWGLDNRGAHTGAGRTNVTPMSATKCHRGRWADTHCATPYIVWRVWHWKKGRQRTVHQPATPATDCHPSPPPPRPRHTPVWATLAASRGTHTASNLQPRWGLHEHRLQPTLRRHSQINTNSATVNPPPVGAMEPLASAAQVNTGQARAARGEEDGEVATGCRAVGAVRAA